MEYQHRKPTRSKSVDYGAVGYYFVTLCTHHRQPLFSIENPTVGNGLCAVPNQIIHTWICETQNKYENITIDKYIIMPDHIHMILNIREQRMGSSLPDVMRFFKTMTTNAFIRTVKRGVLSAFDTKLWQKSYYDHVIRNQQDYNEVWEYIENTPAKWMMVHNLLE